MDDFQIFLDKDLQKPAGDPINLGKLKAGGKKQYVFYVYNSSMWAYEELKFTTDSKEVKVISFPESLEEKRSSELIIEWKPKVDIKQGLKAKINISGYQVVS